MLNGVGAVLDPSPHIPHHLAFRAIQEKCRREDRMLCNRDTYSFINGKGKYMADIISLTPHGIERCINEVVITQPDHITLQYGHPV